jgi:uncharacterized paraquat-inducible protein A
VRSRCESCGHSFSDSAAWCPTCGARVHTLFPWRLVLIVAGILLLIVVAILLLMRFAEF